MKKYLTIIAIIYCSAVSAQSNDTIVYDKSGLYDKGYTDKELSEIRDLIKYTPVYMPLSSEITDIYLSDQGINGIQDTVKPKVFYGIAGVKKEPIDSSKIFWRRYVTLKNKGIKDSINPYYKKLSK